MASLKEAKKNEDTMEVRAAIVQKFVDYATKDKIKPPYNKVVVSEAFTSWWAFLSVTERLWGIKYGLEVSTDVIVEKLKSADSGTIYNEVVKEIIASVNADEFLAGVMVARGFRILAQASPVVANNVNDLGNVDSEVVLISEANGVRLWGALVQRNDNINETANDLHVLL